MEGVILALGTSSTQYGIADALLIAPVLVIYFSPRSSHPLRSPRAEESP
jgi:hypothetical protein